MFDELLARLSITQHGLFVLLALSVYVVGTYTLKQRRRPSAAFGWVISLVLIPYVALPLYLVFGNRKVFDRRPHEVTRAPTAAMATAMAPGADTPEAHLQSVAAAMRLPRPTSYEGLSVHQDGAQALEALHRVIDEASVSLDVCTFIFGRDAVGDGIKHALERRARDGVRVRLLVDGVGAYLSGFPDFKRLSAAGVKCVLFVPPVRSSLKGRMNMRIHRKAVIADGDRLWCGGRNLANAYFGDASGSTSDPGAWADLTFDLRGPVATQVRQQFDRDWAFATGAPRPVASPGMQGQPPMGQLIASGPDQSDDTIYTVLVQTCFAARRRILAVTPYFIPDPTLLMSLCLAARRGLAVDIVMPQRSNHRLADVVRHRALRELAAAGGRIWLVPGMIHAKAVVVDDHVALVGSANLDERSLFLNYELMVAFYDGPDITRFADWIDVQRHRSAAYRAHPPGLVRDVAEGLLLWLGFQI